MLILYSILINIAILITRFELHVFYFVVLFGAVRAFRKIVGAVGDVIV